jgi:ELWxxDGT repeat protein
VYNYSVWVSDGTPEGTYALTDSDVLSGSVGVAGGKIYFTRYDAQHGLEPWVTDGTKGGTKLVADLEPGVTGGNPQNYVRAGDLLFFTATTSATGEELWALPLSPDPGLSVNDITAAEGDSGTTTAHFTVTLSPASTQPVAVDYATVDDSAVAGSDYDAASGTLTFAAGETSKTIDVHLRGDTTLENNESFFLSLRNASGARLGKSTGFALIEEDDQAADVALSLAVSNSASLGVTAQATNNGPRTATGLQLQVTQTPYDRNSSSSSCQGVCPVPEVQLRTGAKSTAYVDGSGLAQRYVTATLTARELDPQASNNSIAWTAAGNIAMDALFLTPGSDAHVWFGWPFTVSVESSNPAVVSVPASVSVTSGSPGTFIAHGVSVGKANIRVFNSFGTLATLAVDVVAPGTMPLWNGGVSIDAGNNTAVRFDQQLAIHISASGTAPFTGKRATGTVTVAAGGREIGRVTLDPATQEGLLWTYLPDLGATNINAIYSGDANFAPSTLTAQGFALLGRAMIAATIDDNGGTARLHVRLIGSPMAAPAGSISVYEVSLPAATQIPLTSTTPGVAEADITLTNLPAGTHTFRVFYPGDGTHYQASAQDFREVDARKRGVRH